MVFKLLNINASLTNNIIAQNVGLSNSQKTIKVPKNIYETNIGSTKVVEQKFVASEDFHEFKLTELDNFVKENKINSIDYIKIDIEGHELECIKGGELTLRRYSPVLTIEVLKEDIGYQDQIAVTYGGINYIKFKKNDFKITNIKISPKTINKFKSNFFLLDTGIKRYSSIIQKKLVRSFETSRPNSKVIFEMVEYSNIAKKLLSKGNLDDLGYLFKEYWNLKIKSNPYAINNEIFDIYNMAINKGALSGKLLGAGSGGFFLFYVKDENKNNFSKLGKLFNIYPLELEFDGTKLFKL